MKLQLGPYVTREDESVVRELEDLFGLAEECVSKIDALTAALEKLWLGSLLFIFMFLLFVGAFAGYVFSASAKMGFLSVLMSPGALIFSTLAAVIVAAGGWVALSGQSRRRTLYRELYVEKDVLERLVTLIHEQVQRVAHRGSVSPVTFAMLQIRERRLMR